MDPLYIDESNKIASPYAWIWLMEIASPGYSTPLRFTSNNVDTTWNGNTYTRVPFTFDDVTVSTSGEFPEFKVQVGEVGLSSAFQARYHATGGFIDNTVKLDLVHSDHLALTDPATTVYADILSSDLAAEAVILHIGIPNLLSRRFPRDRYIPAYCRHKFKGALCQYIQPTFTMTSDDVTFQTIAYTAGHPVDRILIGDQVGGINNLVRRIFWRSEPHGSGDRDAFWNLFKDTGFTVSGSLYNDGFFLADKFYQVFPTYVLVKTGDESGRDIVPEANSTRVTITLGYNQCDHTLEACRLRDNSQNYGGSPGIAGGIYG